MTRVAGNVVFGSGCNCEGPRPERVEDEVEAVLERAGRALDAAGCSLRNVVKTYFLLTDLADYGPVRATETEFYERYAPELVTTPPAATLMVAPSLARPELRVQYEVIAALDRDEVTYHPEYWGGRELAYPHVPKEHAKFARSQAIGDLLIVSGCQALDHDTVRVETGDFVEQSRIVLDKVRVAVEETGGSLADVVKTNVFVKDATALVTYREVERAFFGEIETGVPASSAFVVEELPRPEFLVEVEAFALPGGTGQLVFTEACTGSTAAEALTALDGTVRRMGSSLDDVVKLTAAVLDPADTRELETALAGLETRPATTFLQVKSIERAGTRFQFDAVAVA